MFVAGLGTTTPCQYYDPMKRMKRIVRPELLDTLSPHDSRAVRSRGDLHRVNTCMRNHALMADALQNVLNPGLPTRITELGAGDGRFFQHVADRLRTVGEASSGAPEHPTQVPDIALLDIQSNVSADRAAPGYNRCGPAD